MAALKTSTIITGCLTLVGGATCLSLTTTGAVPGHADGPTTLLFVGAAVMAGVGLLGSIASVVAAFGQKPASASFVHREVSRVEAFSEVRDSRTHTELGRVESRIEGLDAKVGRLLAAVGASPEADAPTADAPVRESQVRAAENVLTSNDPLDETARRAAEAGDVDAVIASLMKAARYDRTTAARRFRDAGALAFSRNVALSIEAYEDAAALDPTDTWTQIFLCRLYQAHGRTADAERAARAAVELSNNARDRSCALNDLGDVLVQEGDLPAARKAFENSLVIAEDLTARDPKNTQWQRDLSVSFIKLGDVARAEGDLPAARRAFEDGLVIRKDLTARDPKNTEWQRDLSVSFNTLGDVAQAEGDLPAARKAFEDSLVIHKDLAVRDPKNTQWQRDLSVSYERLGDLAQAENDPPAALAMYQLSRPIAEALAKKDRTNAGLQRDLEITERRIEQLKAMLGRE